MHMAIATFVHLLNVPHKTHAIFAAIVKPAHATFYGGYAGYFQDPDGHLWEVAFNPHFDALG